MGQQLVLQAVSSHSEVDEGGLGLDLWLVVRVGQLGVKNEPEFWVEEALFVPNLYTAMIKEHDEDEERTIMKRRRLYYVILAKIF